MSFVLCDPGLVIPPNAEDVSAHRAFWVRVIEWAHDRRLKLGVESFQVLFEEYERRGWPDYEEPMCPVALSVDARTAVARLLSSVRTPRRESNQIPQLSPRYIRDEDAECALAMDFAAEWEEDLLGVATSREHWERLTREILLAPPPPESVAVILEPNQIVQREIDQRVAADLRNKRVTIVGALRDEHIVRFLAVTFDLRREQFRWLESEPGRQPRLDGLRALSGHRDIVCCILGAPGQLGLGHAGSEKAIRLAENRGVKVLLVDRPNQIVRALRGSFGG